VPKHSQKEIGRMYGLRFLFKKTIFDLAKDIFLKKEG
jgi:hypothetical protein